MDPEVLYEHDILLGTDVTAATILLTQSSVTVSMMPSFVDIRYGEHCTLFFRRHFLLPLSRGTLSHAWVCELGSRGHTGLLVTFYK